MRHLALIAVVGLVLAFPAACKGAREGGQQGATDESTQVGGGNESTLHGNESLDLSAGGAEAVGATLAGWVKTWGSGAVGMTRGVKLDAAGNLYVTGMFSLPTDFDPGSGTVEIEPQGEIDCFLVKFDPAGGFLWVRTWGGPYEDRSMGLAVDRSGNSFVAGTFRGSVDFNPGGNPEESQLRSAVTGKDVAFLCSLGPGGEYRWVRTWGGPGGELDVTSVALDRGGNPVVTGWFSGSIDFDDSEDRLSGAGRSLGRAASSSDAYVVAFGSSSAFRWVSTWGGGGAESPGSLEMEGPGGGPGGEPPSLGGASGSVGVGIGTPPEGGEAGTGGQEDQMMCTSIAVDPAGNIIVAGRFMGAFRFAMTGGLEMNAGWERSAGGEDAFVAKLDSSGTRLWARRWGGASHDYALAVAAGPSGDIYVTGSITGTADLDPDRHGVTEQVVETRGYVFLSKFSTDGAFRWGVSWGDGVGMGVAVDPNDNVAVTGTARGPVDFDPDPSPEAVDRQTGNVFISRFDSRGDYLWARVWGRAERDLGASVTTDVAGNIYGTGLFSGMIEYTSENGFTYIPLLHDADAYLIKFRPDGSW